MPCCKCESISHSADAGVACILAPLCPSRDGNSVCLHRFSPLDSIHLPRTSSCHLDGTVQLPHFFDQRMSGSYEHASAFLMRFPKPMLASVMRVIRFYSGAIVAVMLVLTFLEVSS